MNHLTKTLPIYEFELGGLIHSFQWDEIIQDDNEGPMAEVHGPMVEVYGAFKPVTATREREAKWWTVAVYTEYSMYGGPEEGGWYYYAGQLTEHGRIRFFDDYDAAEEYRGQLWDWVGDQNDGDRKNCDEKLTVRCTTESMPDTHYPLKRPYYS